MLKIGIWDVSDETFFVNFAVVSSSEQVSILSFDRFMTEKVLDLDFSMIEKTNGEGIVKLLHSLDISNLLPVAIEKSLSILIDFSDFSLFMKKREINLHHYLIPSLKRPEMSFDLSILKKSSVSASIGNTICRTPNGFGKAVARFTKPNPNRVIF